MATAKKDTAPKASKPKARRVSDALLKSIIRETPGITSGEIMDVLQAEGVLYNTALVDGMLELMAGNSITNEDDSFSIKSAATSSKLYVVANFISLDLGEIEVQEFPYSRDIEETNPLAKRSKIQALKAAKSRWYQEVYKPVLAEWDRLMGAEKVS